jgi:hydroxymethylbilane synthase
VVSGSAIRIASRGSDLALWQARTVAAHLRVLDAAADIRINVVRTTGDRILDVPLARIGERGLFTKELDTALLAGEAEVAVHSLKDVPTRMPGGLRLAAVMDRADPRDVVLTPAGASVRLGDLPPGARVGTSSLRRRAQLLARRPDLRVDDLRGNLNTRLAKLDAGEYDAILLAAAGVIRLGWEDRITEYLSPPEWLPAVGQGALGIVAREDDATTLERIAALHHRETAACTSAERAFLRAVEGGCQIPVGALATVSGAKLRLDALIAGLDGTDIVRGSEVALISSPELAGERLADDLLSRGGEQILAEVRRHSVAPPPFVGP